MCKIFVRSLFALMIVVCLGLWKQEVVYADGEQSVMVCESSVGASDPGSNCSEVASGETTYYIRKINSNSNQNESFERVEGGGWVGAASGIIGVYGESRPLDGKTLWMNEDPRDYWIVIRDGDKTFSHRINLEAGEITEYISVFFDGEAGRITYSGNGKKYTFSGTLTDDTVIERDDKYSDVSLFFGDCKTEKLGSYGKDSNKYTAVFTDPETQLRGYGYDRNTAVSLYEGEGTDGPAFFTCTIPGDRKIDYYGAIFDDGSTRSEYSEYIRNNSKSISIVLEFDENGNITFEKSITLNDSQVIDEDHPDPIGQNLPSGDDGVDEEMNCVNSGSGESLGWIICPVLEWLAGTAQNVYTDYVEPSLRIEPQLFKESNTRKAWETFRDFANVVFIIVLLFVIFSQVTGVGIDNYGIKKILPKLIVTAVLVNLSFVICQLCVDISNIAGNSFNDLLSGLEQAPSELTINANSGAGVEGNCGTDVDCFTFPNDNDETGSGNPEDDTSSGDGGVGATIITGVVLLTIIVVGARAIWSNPGILISLLVAALGIVVAIFFLFILLTAREAAIVVLTVISPIAFACYMLPNTKKLFDKWLKFGEGLLLVYPICGLLVGGGNFVCNLLLNIGVGENSFLGAFTAMAVGVLPIFFIPMIIRGAFSAMGRIGATVSGWGGAARRATTGAINRAPQVQNMRKMGLDRANRKRLQRQAGGTIDADGNFQGRGIRRRIAGTRFGRRLGMDVRMGEAQTNYVNSQIARNQSAAHIDPVFANQALQEAKTELENAKIKAEVEVELGPKPVLKRENYRTRMQNQINELKADNDVPVLPVDYDLAIKRRKSARDAQEYKAFQDQFAGMSQAELKTIADRAGDWFNRGDAASIDSSQQRMRALISSMNRAGMENDVFKMLENSSLDIGNSTAVMSELANSDNKVMKAYGKKGAGVSYNDFMEGTMYRDSNGNLTTEARDSTGALNTSVSMKQYVAEKGVDFLDGLDDKALRQISAHDDSTGKIMSNEMVVEGLSRINSQDAVNVLEDMAKDRRNLQFSGEQLTQFNASTVERFVEKAQSGDAAGNEMEKAIINAARDVANTPSLNSKLSSQNRGELRKVGPVGSIL